MNFNIIVCCLFWSRSVSPQGGQYSRDRYSRSPPYNGSRSQSLDGGEGRSRSPRRSLSHSPRRVGSPIRTRSRSPDKRELNGERSPSQWCCAVTFVCFLLGAKVLRILVYLIMEAWYLNWTLVGILPWCCSPATEMFPTHMDVFI